MNHWLISALGAGWGHVNRAIALGRQLAQRDMVHILTNSPYAQWIQSQIPLVESSQASAHLRLHILGRSSIEQVRAMVEAIALSHPWTGIIVDTFPRGLVGEWVDLWPQLTQHYPLCRHILIQRTLNPDYLRAKQVPTFICQHYHHILLPGEGIELLEPLYSIGNRRPSNAHPTKLKSSPTSPSSSTPYSEHSWKLSPAPLLPCPPTPPSTLTAPWLMRNAIELPDQPAIRLQFSIPNRPLIVVCAAGNPSELELFGVLTAQLTGHCPNVQVRCLAFDCPPLCPTELWIRHWPGMELLQLADVVIGGGGYNTVYECAALGIPLVAFSFDRLYDRQHRRLQQYGYLVKTVEEAIAMTQMILAQTEWGKSDGGRSRCAAKGDRPTYENGVTQAIQTLTQSL